MMDSNAQNNGLKTNNEFNRQMAAIGGLFSWRKTERWYEMGLPITLFFKALLSKRAM